MPNTELFKKLGGLLEQSGITHAEAAQIFQTSRPTIYSWCEGRAPTQTLVKNAAVRIMAAIEQAVKEKELPVMDLERGQRVAALRVIIKKYYLSRR